MCNKKLRCAIINSLVISLGFVLGVIIGLTCGFVLDIGAGLANVIIISTFFGTLIGLNRDKGTPFDFAFINGIAGGLALSSGDYNGFAITCGVGTGIIIVDIYG